MHYQRLALVIIDEQHRFGVHQRLQLRQKGSGFSAASVNHDGNTNTAHLSMTAYADLATSVIDELPPGRTPVTTVAIPDTRPSDSVLERSA